MLHNGNIMEAIYYDWSTSCRELGDSGLDGKNECRQPAQSTRHEPSDTTICTNGTYTDTRNPPVQFEKRTHTSDTRESLRLDGIISASISVSRTIEITSRSHSLWLYACVSFAFDSFMTVYLNEFEHAFPLSQVLPLGDLGVWRLHASSGRFIHSGRRLENMCDM